MPHQLIKGGQQGLGEVVGLQETFSIGKLSTRAGTFHTHTGMGLSKGEESGHDLLPLGSRHGLIKGCKMGWIFSTGLEQMHRVVSVGGTVL